MEQGTRPKDFRQVGQILHCTTTELLTSLNLRPNQEVKAQDKKNGSNWSEVTDLIIIFAET